MNSEVNTSFGTDNDQIKLLFKAKSIASIVDLAEGTILRLSSNEYGIIKNGTLNLITTDEVPKNFLDAYAKFEQLENPPKYPYLIVLVNHDGKR